MTDLHTHILPGMDDGARDADESVVLLRQEQAQGVDTVVLTPHFYRDRETPGQFLRRRAEAFEKLSSALNKLPVEERQGLPRLILGAEVAWDHALRDCEQIQELCIGQTKNLLLELPFTPWSDHTINLIYDLMGSAGIAPVIAHLERYLKSQSMGRIRDILEMGVPVQISAEALRYPLLRRQLIKLLRGNQIHLIASDCHCADTRPPNLKMAMDVVRKKLGDQRVEELICCGDELAVPCPCE